MNNAVLTNISRFLLLLFIQGLILKRLSLGWEGIVYVNVMIYPLFILLMPLRTPRPVILLSAFALGIGVDLFYGTLGLHTSATVLTAYARSYVLAFMEPREGYNVNYSPTKARMGAPWFLRYASIMMGIHLIAYFSIDAFSPQFFFSIVIKALYTFLFSLFFIIIIMQLFNPTD